MVRLVPMVGVLGVVRGLRRTLRISRMRTRSIGRCRRRVLRVRITCSSIAATATLSTTPASMAGLPCAALGSLEKKISIFHSQFSIFLYLCKKTNIEEAVKWYKAAESHGHDGATEALKRIDVSNVEPIKN